MREPSDDKGGSGNPSTQYRLLAVCVVAQALTVGITWPLWQTRTSPPHLPLVDVPQWPFGVLMLLSLLAVLIRPRIGLALHAAVWLIACVVDQFRTQPQFFALLMLMFACTSRHGLWIGRWFLAAMWLWAGLHKFLSDDWFGDGSWRLVAAVGIDPAGSYLVFATVVAASEVALGLLAVFRPLWAAPLCLALHLGIGFFLSPLVADRNISVIPWNLCNAVVGAWILRSVPAALPADRWQWSVAAFWLLLPIGFYAGWVDHGMASVLYSENLPVGLITTAEGTEEITGWGALRVPFPNERRLLRMYFARTAPPGSKLHIADPRPWLADQYFLKGSGHRVVEISPARFFAGSDDEVAGVGHDSRRSMFALSQANARMLRRSADGPVYAVELPPHGYRPQLLDALAGLPNLEQLQLRGCPVSDDDLRHLPLLHNLTGIGLEDTQVSDAGLKHLRQLPSLSVLEHQGTSITDAALRRHRLLGLP